MSLEEGLVELEVGFLRRCFLALISISGVLRGRFAEVRLRILMESATQLVLVLLMIVKRLIQKALGTARAKDHFLDNADRKSKQKRQSLLLSSCPVPF